VDRILIHQTTATVRVAGMKPMVKMTRVIPHSPLRFAGKMIVTGMIAMIVRYMIEIYV